MKQHYVYWVHLPEHTDIKTEGYVGVTSNLKKRKHAHEHKSSTCIHFRHALNKHKDKLIWDTILISSMEGCFQVEEYFRPTEKIGWNIAIGGSCPMAGRKHSEATKQAMSKVRKGKPLSETAKEKLRSRVVSDQTKAKISAFQKGRIPSKETVLKRSKPVKCIETNKIYINAAEAALATGIKSGSNIQHACTGKSKSAGGYTWEYIKKEF